LYERMTGKIFTKAALTYQEDDVHRAVSDFIATLK
jgi:hypothetical protein